MSQHRQHHDTVATNYVFDFKQLEPFLAKLERLGQICHADSNATALEKHNNPHRSTGCS